MSEATSASELGGLISLRQQTLERVVADIRAVLQDHTPLYVEREAKRAFVAHPEVADAMPAARVAELKAEVEALGVAAATRLGDELAEPALWRVDAPPPEDRRSLAPLTAVCDRLRGVEADLQALLERYGIAEAAAPAYKPPVIFIGGRYLPALVESYWKLVQELREIEQQLAALGEAAAHERLAEKWNGA